MKRYIEVTPTLRRQLQSTFQCTPRTVYNALNYVADTPIQQRIRRHAIQKGGIPMVAFTEEEINNKNT